MNGLFSPPTIWFLAGLALLLSELAIPGLVVGFFGVGAWATALVLLFLPVSFELQLVIFLVASLLSLALLRGYLKKRYFNNRTDSGGSDLDDDYIGHIAEAITPFDSDGFGKVTFRGTIWTARSAFPLLPGERVRITGYDSIHLLVDPLNNPTL